MTITLQGANAFDAWENAARLLLSTSGGVAPCIVTTIDDSKAEDTKWYSHYDSRRPKGFEKLSSVVEVLAPRVLLASTMTREARYDRAWQTFDRFRARGGRLSGWHDTYFERLTRGPSENRLESLVDALHRWGTNPSAALYAHIEGKESQSLRTRGSPCLQYIQFGVYGGVINLTGLYRSHDFERKALGNFIGLTRLLRFAATETGRTAGIVRCVSLHAHCTNKSNLSNLVP